MYVGEWEIVSYWFVRENWFLRSYMEGIFLDEFRIIGKLLVIVLDWILLFWLFIVIIKWYF